VNIRHFAIRTADKRGVGARCDRLRERRRADLRSPNALGGTPQPGG